MNIKKFFSVFLVLTLIFVLAGCGKGPSEALWNKYVDAVNKKNLNEVAKTFGTTEKQINSFLENNKDYLTVIKSIETVSYELKQTASFTSRKYVNEFYFAEVKAKINGNQAITFNVYSRKTDSGSFFCSQFNFLDSTKDYGNQPDSEFIKKMYYTTDEYIYKYNDAKTEIIYVQNLSNTKKITIPNEIEGLPVTTILRDAFLNVNSFLSFTRPNSKLEEIVIGDNVKTIGERAFYQCTKLKEISIPTNVQSIGSFAFAGCTNVKKIHLYVETEETVDKTTPVPSVGTGLEIIGGYNLLVGDMLSLSAYTTAGGLSTAKWKSSNESVAKIDPDTGELTALGHGPVTITATVGSLSATLSLTIVACNVGLNIYYDAFNRLNNLTEIYIYARNPLTININGATNKAFNFSANVKIYVPQESIKMYKTNANWSVLEKQIYGFDA